MVRARLFAAFLCAVPCALSFLPLGPLTAAPDSLEAWLPDDVVGYVRIEGLGNRLEEFLDSSLRKDIEVLPVVQYAKSQEQWRDFEKRLAEFRAATGKEPIAIFKDLLGREAVLALRLGLYGPEVILLARASGAKELEDGLAALRKAAEQGAGHPIQGYRSTYCERTIETIDQLNLATVDDVAVMANTREAVERVIDLATGKAQASVRSSEAFKAPLANVPRGAMAYLVARTKYIPNFHVPEKADDAMASLLIGGWIGALQGSEWLTASLDARDDSGGGMLVLDIASILSEDARKPESWKKYGAFFPEAAPDDLVSRLEGRGILGAIRLHRDLVRWWREKEALIASQATGGLYEFAQVLGMAFGGRDFETQILPELGKRLTIVARNQEYPGAEAPRPAIPGFAAILEVGSDAETRTQVATAFQTVAGFVNIDRAQKGQEPAAVRTDKVGEAELHVLGLPKDAGEPHVPVNFTPSLAVVGGKLILSSSAELGKVLVEEIQKGETQKGETRKDESQVGGPAPESGSSERAGAGTPADALVLDGSSLRAILEANRDLLVNDNMAKNGHSREAAEREVGYALEALRCLESFRMTSGKEGEAVKARLELRVRSPKGSVKV
jgi:hypothetical protein